MDNVIVNKKQLDDLQTAFDGLQTTVNTGLGGLKTTVETGIVDLVTEVAKLQTSTPDPATAASLGTLITNMNNFAASTGTAISALAGEVVAVDPGPQA